MSNYTALMLDLDGTTVPNDKSGMPSEKVIEAIKHASNKVSVCLVTGRPYHASKKIIEVLQLKSPSVFNGGGKIIDLSTDEILWKRYLSEKTQREIFEIIKSHDLTYTFSFDSGINKFGKDLTPHYEDTISISVVELTIQKAYELKDQLIVFKDIAIHFSKGYEDDNNVWLQITHAEATKQHAVFEVAKLLNIDTHEIIGVGDSLNDFPLLMACGLKVAMGNAVMELKEIADYIAPSVDEDGVADVIEKFILKL